MILAASGIKITGGEVIKRNHESTSDKPYQIASCSKFITGIVVAKLFEQGKLDYDTDINHYLTSWKCPGAGVTLRHLLTHTSGSTDRNGFLGRDPQVPTAIDLRRTKFTYNGRGYAIGFNLNNPLGEQCVYSGAGYQVVQQIIEDITNTPLYQLMEQLIFTPLEMNNSTAEILYESDPRLYDGWMGGLYRMYPETAAAGVWMSANDMVKLLFDIMNGYNSDTSRILKQSTIKMITKGEHPEWQSKKENYGLGVNVDTYEGAHMFSHGGSNYGFKSKFYCVPEKGIIDVILVNSSPKYHGKDIRNMARDILKM